MAYIITLLVAVGMIVTGVSAKTFSYMERVERKIKDFSAWHYERG